MINKILIGLLLNLACYNIGMAQTTENNYPTIGQPISDLQFNDVQYYPTKQLNLNSIKGKWVILDFWHKGCSACMEEFPHLDSLQKQFEEKVKIILVGYTGSQYFNSRGPDELHIKKTFERLKMRDHLSLTIAYDSTIFHQLGVYVPLKIIIDPKGIVRGITYKLTSEDMRLFLSGVQPRLPKSWFKNENQVTYSPELPFLVNGNGGNDTDFLYRSVLSEYKDYMQSDNQSKFAIKGNKLQVLGVDLASLYRFAYTGAGRINYGDSLYGKVGSNPILELKDTTPFKVDKDFRTGMYAFSIAFPSSKSDKANVMKMVQRDLLNYFGYTAKVEIRKMPVWKLVTATKIKRISRLPEGTPSYPFESIDALLGNIAGNNAGESFFDFTSIQTKIDLILRCKMNDLEDVRRALLESGFDLVKGAKEMQVLVIKDNPDENN